MNRRQLLQYAQLSLWTAITTSMVSKIQPSLAQGGNSLTVQWLGHTCCLITSGNLKVLVNPFRQIGCTKGYRLPQAKTDVVLISSRLFDEGSVQGLAGDPILLYEPGVYKFEATQFQGIGTKKDREQGRRFGVNVAWLWQQAGIKILHLGGLAGAIDIEEQILIGRPDILFLPVGGGPKAYQPAEAKKTAELLKPKLIIPTHYRTEAADPATCDLVAVEDFLNLMAGAEIRRINSDKISLNSSDLSDNNMTIAVLTYPFNITPSTSAPSPSPRPLPR